MADASHSTEWLTADIASLFGGYVSIPMNASDSAMSVSLVLAKHQVVLHFLLQCRVFDQQVVRANRSNRDCQRLSNLNLLEMGSTSWMGSISREDGPLELASTAPSDVVTLQFTSGSTGSAKAVPFTDQMLNERFMSAGTFRVAFAFQPPGYATQRHSFYRVISGGGKLVLHSGDMSTFWREVAASQVTSFGAPPRIFAFLHSIYEQRASIVGQAAASAECMSILDERCSTIHVGGALTSVELLNWMRLLWKSKVQDGYGCTECGSISKNGVLDQCVRIIVEPESPSPQSEPADDGSIVGVLWVHTRNCATGYVDAGISEDFRKINETSLNGDSTSIYYNTGDRVKFWPSCNKLQVIGRVKSKLRLSNATFVDADEIQSAISKSPKGFYNLGNVLVYCRSSSNIVVAIVQVRNSIQPSSTLRAEIVEEMQSSCKSRGVPALCIPCQVVIDTQEWTVDNGCITASGKLIRLGIETRVADQLDAIYGSSHLNPEKNISSELVSDEMVLNMEIFNNLIRQFIPLGNLINCSLSLTQNGLDSISIAQLATHLQKFKTKIPVSTTILHSHSITRLTDLFLIQNYSDPTSFECIHAIAESDANIPHDLSIPMLSPDSVHPKNGVFLTGASGFLGIHILSTIMKQVQLFQVFCLVRSSNEYEAMSRLKRQAADANLEIRWSSVSVVVGDLSLPLFGLDPAEFASLASKVDFVVHNGALVHWLKDYDALRQSNVIGTHTCARLAHMASAKTFVFISTSSAILSAEKKSCGKPGTSLLSLETVRGMTGYGATKRVSEVFLCRFSSLHPGLTLRILRPTTIISPECIPSYNLYDAFSRYIQACFILKAVPIHDETRLHFISVDTVAKVAVESLIDCPSGDRNLLNILCGSGLSISRVSRCISSSSTSDMKSLPLNDWLQLVRTNCPSPLQPLFYIFQREKFPWSSSHDIGTAPDETVLFQDLSERAVESSSRWIALHMPSKQNI